MKMPREILILTALAALAGAALAEPGSTGRASFKLVESNQPQAEIVLPEKASEKLTKDVAYFNESLEKSAKTGLPTVKERTTGKNAILFDVQPMALADDDKFAIEFPDAETMQITCSERSSRWAINHVLQEQAGVVPLYRYETFYPALTNLSVPREVVTRAASFNLKRQPPALFMPEMFEGWNGKADLDVSHLLPRDVFPATKYARNQSWPVEIMPVIGGKKVLLPPPTANTPDNKLWGQYTSNWQPCWSNPKTVDIAVDNILEILAANPDKTSFCLLPNDLGLYCECDACRQVVGNKNVGFGFGWYRDYSELFYPWVNKVAEKVAARYPHVYFCTESYREVKMPPGFKLHPNVAVAVDVDTYATVDPEVRTNRWNLINAWSEQTAILGLSDYALGSIWFMVPRVYYKLHAQYIKDFYRKGGRTAVFEGWLQDPSEGPKYYLMMKLFWDVNADPEKLINEWITACVGAPAAPYLRQYYQFWEDYWMGADIRKTKWFEAKTATYMAEKAGGTTTFALKKGDMARCRKLMEQVVANAGTPDQKRRANYLMSLFEISENGTIALFSELIEPEGRLASADQAVEMLKSVPGALKAAEAFHQAPRSKWFGFVGDDPQLLPYLANNLGMVLPFLNDPSVKAALTTLADQPGLPPLLRGQFKLWLGQPVTNLLENGSFESESPLPPLPRGDYRGRPPAVIKRVQEYKHSGDYALMIDNGALRWRATVQAGKTYLFAARVFIPQNSAEGLFGISGAVGVDGRYIGVAAGLPLTRLTAGQWNLFSSTIVVPSKSGWGVPQYIDLYLESRNLEKDERLYIDDVMVVDLDEPKAVKDGP